MHVRTWMTKDPIVVEPEAALPEAHSLLLAKGIRRLPVVEKGQLAGIVTLTDMQKLLFAGPAGDSPAPPGHYTVRDVMTPSPLTIGPNDPIEHAALLMHRNRVGSLPVVEGGKVVGIITETDIFNAFLTIMGLHEQGRRIVLEVERERSGLREILDCLELHGLTLLSLVTLRSHSKTHALVVLRVAGLEVEAFTEDVRNSGLRVLEVH